MRCASSSPKKMTDIEPRRGISPSAGGEAPRNARPFIIPVFIPHAGCPHRCVFCNQHVITGQAEAIPSPENVHSHIQRFLAFKKSFRTPVQVSFYGGNFLGLKETVLHQLLETATRFVRTGEIHGIRFSTRPETVTPHRIDGIRHYPIQTVEIGVQSMDDRVLKLSQRGHTPRHTRTACRTLRESGYEIGLQMMVGLPGDDDACAMQTAARMADLLPDFVRIYPTLVLKNSLLAQWYRQGTYTPLTLESAVMLVKDLYLFFRKKHIPVIRMGIQASDELIGPDAIVAGPYHPAFGHLVHSKIFLDRATAGLASKTGPVSKVVFAVHPGSIPKMRGLKNANLQQLKATFKIQSITVVADASLSPDALRVEACE
jgi:histone acetyltransferase (RNA polymerase elongator complex component)